MTLEELLEQARPLARRIAELHTESLVVGARLRTLIESQREAAGPDESVPPNWYTAVLHLGGVEASGADAERAARTAAAALELTELHDSPRAQALPAATRLELMLTGRLAAHVEGN